MLPLTSMPLAAAATAAKGPTPDTITMVVIGDLVVIMVAARLVAALFRRLRQPVVVGEILAGLLLGPSFLGLFPGDPSKHLFPTYVQPFLSVLAQLGVVLFMFIVGLELNLGLVRGRMRSALGVAVCSTAVPFLAGALLGNALYPGHAIVLGHRVGHLAFVLFIAVSVSVTAFPVLARILTERGMVRAPIGAFVLACAAADDLFSWVALAVVIAVAAAHGGDALPRILGETAGLGIVLMVVVRPALRRLVGWYQRAGRLTPDLLAVVLAGLLLSAWATAEIGIHTIFGAFMFGAIMPREGSAQLFRDILERLEQLSVLLLLPVFFIVTGLSTNVRDIGGSGGLLLLVLLAVASAGKIIGAGGAARLLGFRTRRAAAVGVLMNTRGLTELIVLNIGLTLGVLNHKLYTVLVLTAIITTVGTAPVLRLIYPQRLLDRDLADAERAGLGPEAGYRVIAAISDPDRADAPVDVGAGLSGGMDHRTLVISRFRPARQRVELGSGLTDELATIADDLSRTELLAERGRREGVSASVRAQFATDPLHELVTQAGAADAAAMVLPIELLPAGGGTLSETLTRLAADAGCRVVAVADGAVPTAEPSGGGQAAEGRTLLVAGGAAASDSALIEAAVHLALAWSATLLLTPPGLVAGPGGAGEARPSRWLRSVASRVAGLGIGVHIDEVGDIAAPAALLVPSTALATAAAATDLAHRHGVPVLVVQGRPGAEAEDLDALLRHLDDRAAGRPPVPAQPASPSPQPAQ